MNFPPLTNDNVLRAARGEKIDRLPIWIMRQAGRHLEEYREFRKDKDFFVLCQTPEYACEVTLQPIRRYDMDASIIFSDILVVPQAMGMHCEMVPGKGPHFPTPLTVDSIGQLDLEADVSKKLKYVYDAITLTRKGLEGKVPLIGFCGAPWTLLAYMVEGGGSKTYSKAKSWLYKHEKETNLVLDAITNLLIDYLICQVRAGAQMLQVFESSTAYLTPQLFKKYCEARICKIATEVKRRLGPDAVPMTVFAKDAHYAIEAFGKSDYDVIGVDWCTPPDYARKMANGKVLQGNLDPCALYADEETLKQLVNDMIDQFGTEKYIVNLGHGIYPDMSPDSVQTFIRAVHDRKV